MVNLIIWRTALARGSRGGSFDGELDVLLGKNKKFKVSGVFLGFGGEILSKFGSDSPQ